MSNITRSNVSYALNQPLNLDAPYPIVGKRAPTGADKAPIGQCWVYTTANEVYFLSSIANNVANWVAVAGGAGVFSSLTVTPGPINLTGQFTLIAGTNAVSIGSDAANHSTTIGSLTGASPMILQAGTTGVAVNVANTGTITLGTATMTGAISVGISTGAQTVNIANAAAATPTVNIASGAGSTSSVIIGTTTAASATVISGGATGGITFNSNGNVSMGEATGTAASPTNTVTIDQRAIRATFTGFTTAAAASQVFIVNSAIVAANSAAVWGVSNGGANDAQMTVSRVQQGAGSITFTLTNNGAAALNGDVIITIWIFN